MLNVSEWNIFIDDVEGELAMEKREDTGGRMIEVLAKEEMETSLTDFFHSIKHGDEKHQSWLKDKFENWFNLDIK